MEISDNYRMSLSLQEVESIIKEKVRQMLRDTGRQTPTADHSIDLEYQIDHSDGEPKLAGIDINIDLPWETENL